MKISGAKTEKIRLNSVSAYSGLLLALTKFEC